MTAEIIFASNKLGEIQEHQLQVMLDRFHLGRLVSYKRTPNGAMGQTMLVSSTKGSYILKGNPLYPGQLAEEKFFIEQLHRRTNVTVPIPYVIDDSEDIFGWTYAWMPCLPGGHMDVAEIKNRLSHTDRLCIAEEIADTFAAFHSWETKECGQVNPKTFTIIPFKGSYLSWLYNRILFWLEDAKKYSIITAEDFRWVESLLESSRDAFESFASPTFVMGDFKPGNFLIQKREDGWRISGVFDFTNAYFGDPVSDLIKILTLYLDNGEEEIARHLLNVYFNGLADKETCKKRLKVHMLQQRVLDWGCAKAMNLVTWDSSLSFSDWAKRYTDAAADLFE